jgi:hypothetical protein
MRSVGKDCGKSWICWLHWSEMHSDADWCVRHRVSRPDHKIDGIVGHSRRILAVAGSLSIR